MIRVLIVDDDPAILELAALFLERSGDIQVDPTETAAEGLERLEGGERNYHVVVSDYAMPGMDGIAFLKAVRSRKLEIPFILFTGKSREEVVIEALNSGADYYLQKDGNPKILFAELSHQIRQAAESVRAKREDLIQRNLALGLSGATSLSAALSLCVGAAIAVSETDCGTIYLLERSSGSFILSHSQGFSPEYVEEISRRRRNPSTSLISRAQEPIYIRHQDRGLPLQKAREREGLRAMAVVPIRHEGEVIGYYSVGTHTFDEIPPEGRSGLETIAAMTENAIVRLRAQEELRRSEEQLLAIFETAEVSFVITDGSDPDPTVLEFSPGAEKIFGYRRREMVGNPVSRLHLPEDVALFPEVHRQMREGGRGFSGLTTLVRKNGEKFPAIFSTYPLFDESGQMRAALGVSVDITEQKRMEENLQKSEEYYRAIFENSGTAMAIVEEDGLISKVNSESEALFGRPPQEVEGKMRWDEFISEEDREDLWDLFRKGQRRLKTPTAQYEADLIDRWGGIKRGLFRASIIPRTKQYVVSVTNITEQKRMEVALKESEERLKMAVEGGNLGIWDWNLETGEGSFSDKWGEILGYSPEELKTHLGIWDSLVHPDDRARVKQALMDHLEGLTPYCEIEHRMRSKDGGWVWILGRGKVVSWDERGRPVRMTGVIQEMRAARGGSRGHDGILVDGGAAGEVPPD
ncbi:PAS domain S-box protein [Methanothrix harundinacea]|uniref:histidine kinase n=1 Tax=Methanothrix harundinacea (strain 6Ac) TaxID=1110509 RepID=G7WPN6_METH6|nr:PAS domain S-box protein [Methanothrix harundinacea]AET65398.1 Multi-sensor signal transduction histidine kinase [Methanothrix harundinacea 6Ac]